jgi:hypothetical protein
MTAPAAQASQQLPTRFTVVSLLWSSPDLVGRTLPIGRPEVPDEYIRNMRFATTKITLRLNFGYAFWNTHRVGRQRSSAFDGLVRTFPI